MRRCSVNCDSLRHLKYESAEPGFISCLREGSFKYSLTNVTEFETGGEKYFRHPNYNILLFFTNVFAEKRGEPLLRFRIQAKPFCLRFLLSSVRTLLYSHGRYNCSAGFVFLTQTSRKWIERLFF